MKAKIMFVVFSLMQLCIPAQEKNPMPGIPALRPLNNVQMGDWKSFPEMKLNIPISPGLIMTELLFVMSYLIN
jgi:alpha-L-fucosidase